MGGSVVAAVTQIDAAHERDIEFWATPVAKDDELLMVRTTRADPLVEQTFPAGGFDLLPEMPVFLFAESEAVEMRSPDQSLDDDTASGGGGEQLRDSVVPGLSMISSGSPRQSVNMSRSPLLIAATQRASSGK